MKVSLTEARNEFQKYSPNLQTLIEVVEKCNNSKIQETTSIKATINYKKWDDESQHRVHIIKQALKNLKLPIYHKMPIPQQTNLEQLYWQRKALEHATRATILEAQIQYLIDILSKTDPEQANKYSTISTDIPGETFFEMISSTPKAGNQLK